MRGILNVYKEEGYTSHDVVAKLRGICGMKKIGHTGTLDPDAAGVLPVCLGSATKVCGMLTDRDKSYETVLLLGVRTDTLDTSGTVCCRQDPSGVTPQEIRRAVSAYTGRIRQIPPMYSARKVNGRRLYELARAGIEVERQAREVTIHAIEILSIELPRIRLRIRCSKGTYIRTLCDDIGTALGCGGCMERLLRLESAGFRLEDAHTLAQIEGMQKAGRLCEWLIPVDCMFLKLPAYRTAPEADKRLYNGAGLAESALEALQPDPAAGYPVRPGEESAGTDPAEDRERIRVYDSHGAFKAVYERGEVREDFRPVKMFL